MLKTNRFALHTREESQVNQQTAGSKEGIFTWCVFKLVREVYNFKVAWNHLKSHFKVQITLISHQASHLLSLLAIKGKLETAASVMDRTSVVIGQEPSKFKKWANV